MSQYVPDVTAHDMMRVIERDFPPDAHPTILEWIRKCDAYEKTRSVMAALKNSRGDLTKLEGELAAAAADWRDVISEAEYPNYTRVWLRIERLSPEEVARVIEKDKQQYLAWLGRPEPPETRRTAP
jgi:hypothetical protein